MARVEGVVFKVYEKAFRGRTNYSIKIDGDPLYYRANEKRWAGIAESGNRVTFEAEPNPDGQSARITSDVTLVRNQPNVASQPSAGGGGDRQTSITYQSSRKDALEFLRLAVERDAIKLPAAAGKRLGVLEAALDRYTAQFYEDVNTLGAVIREAEGGAAGEAETESEGEDE